MADKSMIVTLELKGCGSAIGLVHKVEELSKGIPFQAGIPVNDVYAYSTIYNDKNVDFSVSVIVKVGDVKAKFSLLNNFVDSIVANQDIAPFVFNINCMDV